jgi:RNA polymerase-binding transcription factor DksA
MAKQIKKAAKKVAVKKKSVNAKASKTPAKKVTKKVVVKKAAKKVVANKSSKNSKSSVITNKKKANPSKKVDVKKNNKPVSKKSNVKVASKPAKKAPAKIVKKAAPKKAAKAPVKVVKKAAPKKVVKAPVKVVKKEAPKAVKPVAKPVVKAKEAAKVKEPKKPLKPATPPAKILTAAEKAKLPIKKASAAPLPKPAPTPTVRLKMEDKPSVIVAHRKAKETKAEVEKVSKTIKEEFTRSILDMPVEEPKQTFKYSDEELAEFKELILNRLELSRKELTFLNGLITRKDESGTEDTENRMSVDDGSNAMERENLSQMASRQIQFISNLEKALIRIENKTYGICRVTGLLIDKARLRAVPHATLSIEAKNSMKK